MSAGGGCEQAIITRCGTAWGKFRKLLPILTSRHVTLETKGKVFDACVRSAMLHGSETWAPTARDLQRLRRNDRSMIRWICGTKPDDQVPTDVLYTRLGVQDVAETIRSRRLRWFGHVQRASSGIKTVMDLEVQGTRGRGRPRKSWMDCIKADRVVCGLDGVDPQDRDSWRLGVRQSVRLLPTPVTGTPAAEEK